MGGVRETSQVCACSKERGEEERKSGSGAGAETLLCGKDQRKMLKCKYI